MQPRRAISRKLPLNQRYGAREAELGTKALVFLNAHPRGSDCSALGNTKQQLQWKDPLEKKPGGHCGRCPLAPQEESYHR